MNLPKSLRCGLLLSLSIGAFAGLRADDMPVNWPVPVPPPDVNPATFATPRNDWMIRFAQVLDRARAGDIDLAFEGDSITQGWGGAGSGIWKDRYAGRKAASFGINGDKTENVLWKLQKGEFDGLKPKLIVLMIGTNNTGRDQPAQIAEGIGAVVKEIRSRCPESHLLLLGVFPRAKEKDNPTRAKIAEINRLIAPLADGKSVTFLDIGNKFLAEDGTLPADIMPDALHPNAKGYAIWADAIQEIVDKYVPGGTNSPKPQPTP
jgi:lysophospholipase L1-like esterase